MVWVVADKTDNGSESGTSFRQALYFMDLGFNLHDTMIYEQAGTGAKGSIYSYWQSFEYMFVFSKNKPNTVNRIQDVKNKTFGMMSRGGRFRNNSKVEKPHATSEIGVRSNVWRYSVGFADNSDKTNHPAPYPEQLALDHIITWSKEGDFILDPFMGSGTTGKMAVLNNRDFIGIEVAEEYMADARERIRRAFEAPTQIELK